MQLAVDHGFVFSFPRGIRVVGSILIAKLLRQPYIDLPIPRTARPILLLTNAFDIITYNQIFIRRDYDFSYFPQAAQPLSSRTGAEGARSSLTIIVCGANFGCSVIRFAREFPGAEIIVVDPDLANFALLKENVAQVQRVRAIRAVLSCSETRVVISKPDGEPWAFRTQTVTGDMERQIPLIDTVTMGRPMVNHAISARIIVKIEIEGAEHEVFSKNTSWFSSIELLIIEVRDQMFLETGNGRAFLYGGSAEPMDYIWRGENLFCFQQRGSASAFGRCGHPIGIARSEGPRLSLPAFKH
jgi:FkbM family methyltransferase